jgi:hypothetical protein
VAAVSWFEVAVRVTLPPAAKTLLSSDRLTVQGWRDAETVLLVAWTSLSALGPAVVGGHAVRVEDVPDPQVSERACAAHVHGPVQVGCAGRVRAAGQGRQGRPAAPGRGCTRR